MSNIWPFRDFQSQLYRVLLYRIQSIDKTTPIGIPWTCDKSFYEMTIPEGNLCHHNCRHLHSQKQKEENDVSQRLPKHVPPKAKLPAMKMSQCCILMKNGQELKMLESGHFSKKPTQVNGILIASKIRSGSWIYNLWL